MPFAIVKQDITTMKVDAIVNAANTDLLEGGGVCGAIFQAAGSRPMQQACAPLAPIQTGQAVMTPGFDLPARHVIHTAGPVWQGGGHGEAALLRQSYLTSLELAAKHKLASIAFPLISSGIYGFPRDQALAIALEAIGGFVLKHDMQVYLTLLGGEALKRSGGLYPKVQAYVDEHYVAEGEEQDGRPFQGLTYGTAGVEYTRTLRDTEPADFPSMAATPSTARKSAGAPTREEALERLRLEETFTDRLLRIIRERDLLEPDVYRRANMDRKLFHKIRSNRHYQPSRKSVLALAVALRLSKDETQDLMARAGFALSPSRLGDVIIGYFLETGNHNIFDINNTLHDFDQEPLA